MHTELWNPPFKCLMPDYTMVFIFAYYMMALMVWRHSLVRKGEINASGNKEEQHLFSVLH